MNESTIKRMHKQQLIDLITSILENITFIRDYYQKLTTSTEDAPSIISDIEKKYEDIIRSYSGLFDTQENGINKINQLYEQYNKIKEFHSELLEGEESIQADINDSHDHINDFYNFLFSTKDLDGNIKTSNEDKVKSSIEYINNFYEELTKAEGKEALIDNIYEKLNSEYEDLFEAADGEESKLDLLKGEIKVIDDYKEKIDKKINPSITASLSKIADIEVDINKKQKEINLLLSNAVGASLYEGYLQSKEEYSKKSPIKFEELNTKSFSENPIVAIWEFGSRLFIWLLNIIYALIHNLILRYVGQLLNYAIFILPLLLICLIFFVPKSTLDSIGIHISTDTFSPLEFLLYKSVVSTPLLWIAWFGQKNLSTKSRLFEEYNHKQRVTQMYLMFSTSKDSYPLSTDSKKDLEKILINVIATNPSEHLGKGETFVDKLNEKYHDLADTVIELKSEVEKYVSARIPLNK